MTRGVPTLVEVTNQIAADDKQYDSVELPPKPQIVFVTSEPVDNAPEVDRPQIVIAEPEVSFAAVEQDSLAVEPTREPSEIANGSRENIVVGDPMSGAWRHQWFYTDEPKFLLDPFEQAVDGPIPTLPALPIVKAIEMTEKVVARERKGVRYAWRLMPGPYPDLGNIPQIKNVPNRDPEMLQQESVEMENVESVVAETEAAFSNSFAVDGDQQTWTSALENASPQEDWQQTEVIAEGDEAAHGDDFYAQPGDVISIDGNQGYDHIDLRSYFLEDATFQPGSILLSPQADNEMGEPQPPIIIRHRAVDAAIFHGDVRVQL